MDQQFRNVNTTIKTEANEILCKKGLLDLLKSYGTPHLSGSYELELMTWKDLDIYLEVGEVNEEICFELGSKICTHFHPARMNFRNEFIGKTDGLPNGMYWGVHLKSQQDEGWKIDIWIVSPAECKRMLDFVSQIKNKLTPETADYIMDIKSKCWMNPLYRRSFTSSDIYSAVLDNKVTSYNEFMDFIHKKIFINK